MYLLGAGASHGYEGSRTGVRPPLAGNFFSTFYRLLISQDFEVKIGAIVNYLSDITGIEPANLPSQFEANIERIFADLHAEMHRRMANGDAPVMIADLSKAYDQFILWFAHVINEIQCGEVSVGYRRLIEQAQPGSTFLTFNWDTLLDRALAESGRWHPDDGYRVEFDHILDGQWRPPRVSSSSVSLLKLHGSTNWLGPYGTLHLQTGRRTFASTPERVGAKCCVVDGAEWFSTYKDRWRPGYTPFSYFFPPNDPVIDTPLMPIIIPPTGRKDFSEFGEVFAPLWQAARYSLHDARRLVVIGYSFPETDSHAFELIDAFCSGTGERSIEIVDPYPEGIQRRIIGRSRGRCSVSVHACTMERYLGLPEAVGSRTEYDLLDAMLEAHPEISEHEHDVLTALNAYSMHGTHFDLTTRSGGRYLDCKVVGELAMHLLTAYRPEVFRYRMENLHIQPDGGEVAVISVSDVLLVVSLPKGKITADALSKVDLSLGDAIDSATGLTMRQMVTDGYHCSTPEEGEAFLRRVLAAERAIREAAE